MEYKHEAQASESVSKLLPSDPEDNSRRSRYRFNLKQILLVVSAIAVLLVVFHHPLSLLTQRELFADQDVRKAAVAPWSLFGWVFFGTPVINPKSLKKSPAVIATLLVNIALAGLLPFGIS